MKANLFKKVSRSAAVIALAAAVGSSMFVSFEAGAAIGTAKAIMKVLTALQINDTSDLIFSEASAGAPSETVDADVVETARNASFAISGEPNQAITVNLPADNTVVMKKGAGGTADTEIAINNFTSNNPTAIGPSGAVNLFVGATRADLAANQQAGNYEADFQVEVVY